MLRENKDKRKFVLKGEKMTKRALISVSDKAGIVEFAQELKQLGWDIISTGGSKVWVVLLPNLTQSQLTM